MLVKKASVSRTKLPVTAPPKTVWTPLALLIADRENEPVIGMEETNDPKKLQSPTAIISCDASTDFPLAVNNMLKILK